MSTDNGLVSAELMSSLAVTMRRLSDTSMVPPTRATSAPATGSQATS